MKKKIEIEHKKVEKVQKTDAVQEPFASRPLSSDPERNATGSTKELLDLIRKMKYEATINPGGPIHYASDETYDETDDKDTEEFNYNWMSHIRR